MFHVYSSSSLSSLHYFVQCRFKPSLFLLRNTPFQGVIFHISLLAILKKMLMVMCTDGFTSLDEIDLSNTII